MPKFDHLEAARYWLDQVREADGQMIDWPLTCLKAHIKRGCLQWSSIGITSKDLNIIVKKAYIKHAQYLWKMAMRAVDQEPAFAAHSIPVLDNWLRLHKLKWSDIGQTEASINMFLSNSYLTRAKYHWKEYSTRTIKIDSARRLIRHMDACLAIAGKTREDIDVTQEAINKILKRKLI